MKNTADRIMTKLDKEPNSDIYDMSHIRFKNIGKLIKPNTKARHTYRKLIADFLYDCETSRGTLYSEEDTFLNFEFDFEDIESGDIGTLLFFDMGQHDDRYINLTLDLMDVVEIEYNPWNFEEKYGVREWGLTLNTGRKIYLYLESILTEWYYKPTEKCNTL